MNKLEAIKSDLTQKFNASQFKFSHAFGDDVLEIPKEDIIPVLRYLKDSGKFDFLMDVCGVDYPTREKRFDVVYHVFSSKNAARLRIKVQVGVDESVDTAIHVWRGADWFEREAWDMFGIKFRGHPNLRRLLTHHQFVGHPLRKDYDSDAQQACTESLPVHFDNEPGRPGNILDE
ncbi:MAG: NADH-quinone oxidoreductase subunit C, partial [Pseudobdellovibrionaceae bacterium]